MSVSKTTKRIPPKLATRTHASRKKANVRVARRTATSRKTASKSEARSRQPLTLLRERFLTYGSLESVLVFGVTGLISSTGLFYALVTFTA